MTRSFNVLGPLEVIFDSEPVNIGGPQQRRLVCALLESGGRTVSVDVLAERLWEDEDRPGGAVQAVRSYVARLRRALDDDGSLVVTNPPGYRLAVTPEEVDALMAEQLLHRGAELTEEDPAAAVDVLEQALGLWRGEPYGEFAGLDWLIVESQRLGELRLRLLERLFAAHVASGSGPDQIGRLERAVAEFPLSERLRSQLMTALAYAGRVSDAARAFQAYRTYVAEETGLEPGPELVQLDADILSGRLTATGSPVGVVGEPPSTIPIPATSLIGRSDTIRRIRALLVDHRLVTLTGVGGCGKTRLAIEVAAQELGTYADGAYFADLGLVVDPDEVGTAVAEALTLHTGSQDLLEQILGYLADKDALLVLDNCEHLIDACASFAEAALRHPGEWRMLATSREHLDIPGEQILQVPSLGADGSSEAEDLFMARAGEIDNRRTVDESDRDIVAELCRRLDGMPLAIELAAARTMVMSPAELLDRIDHRFQVLTGRSRGTIQRQRTLETTLDWSFNLLDGDEQHMLSVLGVFRGPFDVAAAAAVAQRDEFEALDLLQSLIAKSLVERTEHDEGTTYRLLETVRSYAEAMLLQTDRLTDTRHRAFDHIVGTLGEIVRSNTSDSGGFFAWPREVARHWVRLKALLESGIDWAIAAGRYEDAARVLVWCLYIWRETLTPQSILDRLDEVRDQLSAGELREQLWVPEMVLLIAMGDDARLLATVREAATSSNEVARHTADFLLSEMLAETDPHAAAEIAERLKLTAHNKRALADIRLLAGDYGAALDLMVPTRHGFGFGYLLDARIAAALLMSGDPSAALDVIGNQRDADISIRPFAVLRGLCHLELGHRAVAEAEILAEARLGASGRLLHGVDAALIGMAALAHDSGDDVWAADIILNLGQVVLMAQQALARWIADRVGVLDEYHQRRVENLGSTLPLATPYLRQVLARWDETHA